MESSKSHLLKTNAMLVIVCFFITFGFLLSTNPNNLPAIMLLILPLLVLAGSYFVIKLFLMIFTNQPENRIKSVSGVASIAPSLLIILGSVGQLGLQDVVLALVLVAGFSWYLKRLQVANSQ